MKRADLKVGPYDWDALAGTVNELGRHLVAELRSSVLRWRAALAYSTGSISSKSSTRTWTAHTLGSPRPWSRW